MYPPSGGWRYPDYPRQVCSETRGSQGPAALTHSRRQAGQAGRLGATEPALARLCIG